MSTALSANLLAVIEERPTPWGVEDAGYARHTDAGNCARQVAYRVAGVAKSNRKDLAARAPQIVADVLKPMLYTAMALTYPNLGAPRPWRSKRVNGRVDGLYRDEGQEPVVVALHAVSPAAYTNVLEKGRPPAFQVLRASLGALQYEAEVLHMVYFTMSLKGRDGPPVKEYLVPADLNGAYSEISRLSRAAEQGTRGILPRPIFEGRTIERPNQHAFPCSFCVWRTRCVADNTTGTEVIPETYRPPTAMERAG